MHLDLHEIINIPGASVDFDYKPDFSGLVFASVVGFDEPVRAVGSVKNSAGVLRVSALVTAKLRCVCDRCAGEYLKEIRLPVQAVLAEEQHDEENIDLYLLDGDRVDLDEVIITAFVLEMDTKFLCSDSCKGICQTCGKNLNEGPCSCKKETDPRLAVLEQLLKDN